MSKKLSTEAEMKDLRRRRRLDDFADTQDTVASAEAPPIESVAKNLGSAAIVKSGVTLNVASRKSLFGKSSDRLSAPDKRDTTMSRPAENRFVGLKPDADKHRDFGGKVPKSTPLGSVKGEGSDHEPQETTIPDYLKTIDIKGKPEANLWSGELPPKDE